MDKRSREHLQKILDKKLSGYVLITCEEPSANGDMPIEMSYSGDEMLISYLLQNAQLHLEQDENECCSSAANIRLVE